MTIDKQQTFVLWLGTWWEYLGIEPPARLLHVGLMILFRFPCWLQGFHWVSHWWWEMTTKTSDIMVSCYSKDSTKESQKKQKLMKVSTLTLKLMDRTSSPKYNQALIFCQSKGSLVYNLYNHYFPGAMFSIYTIYNFTGVVFQTGPFCESTFQPRGSSRCCTLKSSSCTKGFLSQDPRDYP